MAEKEDVTLPRNAAAALSYVLGLITGIVMLAMRKGDEFVHFHAVQSIGLSLVWVVGWIVLTVIPIVGWIVLPFWGLLMFVFWLVCIVKAYQGERFELPVLGPHIQRLGKQFGL